MPFICHDLGFLSRSISFLVQAINPRASWAASIAKGVGNRSASVDPALRSDDSNFVAAFAFVTVNGEEIADEDDEKNSEYIDFVYPGEETLSVHQSRSSFRLTVLGHF